MSLPLCIICLIISFALQATTKATIALDEFFTNSSYAQLLKEVIIMADTVGLLDNHIEDDERHFIHDSILGKILRISRLIPHMDPDTEVDKAYLIYWLDLAKYGNVPQFIADELSLLACMLNNHFQEQE